MNNKKIEDIYYTLIGVMNEAYCVPGVENLFAEGSECECAYREMFDAYTRLRLRLGTENEDADVETIINSLMKIEQLTAIKMFEYGTIFSKSDIAGG